MLNKKNRAAWLLIGLLVTVEDALSRPWDFTIRVCAQRPALSDEDLRKIWIEVGCRLVDCCADCRPENSRISLEVSASGSVIQQVGLMFLRVEPDQPASLSQEALYAEFDTSVSRKRVLGGMKADGRLLAQLSHVVYQESLSPGDVGELKIRHLMRGVEVNSHLVRFEALDCSTSDEPALRIAGRPQSLVLVDAVLKETNDCVNDWVVPLSTSFRTRSSRGCRDPEAFLFSHDDGVTRRHLPYGKIELETVFGSRNELREVPLVLWLDKSGIQKRLKMALGIAETILSEVRSGLILKYRFKDIPKGVNHDKLFVEQCEFLQQSPVPTASNESINVYINSVIGGYGGRSCPDGDIFLESHRDGSISASLILHELGHSLGLRGHVPCGHTNPVNCNKSFGKMNIMREDPDPDADEFTLGQVFRMNFHAGSWLNRYRERSQLETGLVRDCPPDTESFQCPGIDLRGNR